MKESNSRKGAYIAIAVLSAISILVACTSNNESADSSKTENSSVVTQVSENSQQSVQTSAESESDSTVDSSDTVLTYSSGNETAGVSDISIVQASSSNTSFNSCSGHPRFLMRLKSFLNWWEYWILSIQVLPHFIDRVKRATEVLACKRVLHRLARFLVRRAARDDSEWNPALVHHLPAEHRDGGRHCQSHALERILSRLLQICIHTHLYVCCCHAITSFFIYCTFFCMTNQSNFCVRLYSSTTNSSYHKIFAAHQMWHEMQNQKAKEYPNRTFPSLF